MSGFPTSAPSAKLAWNDNTQKLYESYVEAVMIADLARNASRHFGGVDKTYDL